MLELILSDLCKRYNIELEKEYRFNEKRKFRADFAVISKKLLFEYEGGIFMGKSGHTNITGYTSNCDKYNLAQATGFKVYRFTALHFKKDRIEETYKFLEEVLK